MYAEIIKRSTGFGLPVLVHHEGMPQLDGSGRQVFGFTEAEYVVEMRMGTDPGSAIKSVCLAGRSLAIRSSGTEGFHATGLWVHNVYCKVDSQVAKTVCRSASILVADVLSSALEPR